MSQIKLSILLLSLLAITACGFKPVYSSEAGSANPHLASISISQMEGRSGQVLHNSLEDLLNPANHSSSKRYTLEIDLDDEKREFGIENDLRVTRYEILLTAKYKLIDNNTGQVVLSDAENVYSSFNRTASEFSTFVAEEDSYEKAAQQMAYNIRGKLAAYFTK